MTCGCGVFGIGLEAGAGLKRFLETSKTNFMSADEFLFHQINGLLVTIGPITPTDRLTLSIIDLLNTLLNNYHRVLKPIFVPDVIFD